MRTGGSTANLCAERDAAAAGHLASGAKYGLVQSGAAEGVPSQTSPEPHLAASAADYRCTNLPYRRWAGGP